MSRRLFTSYRLGLALPLCLLLAGCDACPDPPRFYLIAGEGCEDPGLTYNVLLLGSGFRGEDELDFYRWAAHTLAEDLLGGHPFTEVEKGVCFYRADLESDAVEMSRCKPGERNPAFKPRLDPPPPHKELLNTDGEEVLDKELDVEVCWHPDPDQNGDTQDIHVGAKGKARAFEIAAMGPNFAAVVILANTQHASGATWANSCDDGDRLVVAGLPTGGTDGDPNLTQGARGLFAHESGHALGLLDEYVTVSGLAVKFCDDRNVLQPESCDSPPDGISTSILRWDPDKGCKPEVPWEKLLPDECDSGGANPPDTPVVTASDLFWCCGDQLWKPGIPAADAEPLQEGDCAFAPASDVCQTAPLPGTACVYMGNSLPFGVWEGAGYKKKGRYRAQPDCRMRNNTEPFCRACEALLETKLVAYQQNLVTVPE